MHYLRRVLIGSGLLLALLAVFVLIDSRGRPEQGGEITAAALPPELQRAADARQAAAAEAIGRLRSPAAAVPGGASAHPTGASSSKQILFGDLHVHTTFSMDAFAWGLPLMQGEGVHPPADACDYARFCSDLDFWAITDHAEALTARHWRMTKDAIRQCNAVAGDPRDPDLVSLLGFEWTQAGQTPADHYGHKNVIFRETADDRVPRRPINSLGVLTARMRPRVPIAQKLFAPYIDFRNRQTYQDLFYKIDDLASQGFCPEGVHPRDLPEDCSEGAPTPAVLFEKLEQWGFDSLVIPHGTTWGFYTPAGSSLDKQLARPGFDPDDEPLFEVASGHGNSEEYRPWRAVTIGPDGERSCPEPTGAYVPCCHRAGEIIRSRCGDAPAEVCDARVAEAKRLFLDAGVAGRLTIPGANVHDWGECDQCPDCFTPSLNYRPGGSGQYALAIGNFDEEGEPKHFRFGFIASSDNHSARPGTGYKEYARTATTDARSILAGQEFRFQNTAAVESSPVAVPVDPADTELNFLQLTDTERQASYFVSGGLVAVHAGGRDRDAVWAALVGREVYGTSGDRILLWFDHFDRRGRVSPMGSSVVLDEVPRFRVQAVGALEQKPGCPDHATAALAPERIERLCLGECYNPGDDRKRITRIEVVRIRRQSASREDPAELIEDPWKVFDCEPDPTGCRVEFADPEYPGFGRETVYYVRAIEEPSPAVNGANLRCKRDEGGRCLEIRPCFGDSRTDKGDDCLSMIEERAWSSPIYLAPSADGAARGRP